MIRVTKYIHKSVISTTCPEKGVGILAVVEGDKAAILYDGCIRELKGITNLDQVSISELASKVDAVMKSMETDMFTPNTLILNQNQYSDLSRKIALDDSKYHYPQKNLSTFNGLKVVVSPNISETSEIKIDIEVPIIAPVAISYFETVPIDSLVFEDSEEFALISELFS